MDFPHTRDLPLILGCGQPGLLACDTDKWVTARDTSFLQLLDCQMERNARTLEVLREQERRSGEMCEEIREGIRRVTGEGKPRERTEGRKEEEADVYMQLVGFPRNPLFVRRRYELAFRFVSRSGHPLPATIFCSLSVCQASPQSEEVKFTRKGQSYSGKPFLSGELTKEFQSNSECVFDRVVFMDISRDFPMGRVNLVIRCVSLEGVRPICIEGVRIKARKKRPDEDY